MFEDKTYEVLKNDILNNYNLDIAKNEGSFLDEIASGSAIAHASIYNILNKILNIAFIKDSFEDNLDKRVAEFGIKRKHGQEAMGYVTFTGDIGTTIYREQPIKYGKLTYYTVPVEESVVIEDGTVRMIIQAEGVGSEYNIPPSAVLTCDIEGITSITGYTPFKDGSNEETDEELKERFFYIQAHRGTSGNVDDYINWALEVDGVKNVKVIPLWNGNGTVKVVVMTKNNRNVSEEVVEATKKHIESKRPIGASVTVTTPNVLEVQISATVEHDKSVDIEIIKSEFADNVDKYLINAVTEITYTKVAGILSKIDGVIDYSNLTINNGTRNIKLVTDQVGSVGNIILTEGVID